MKKRLMAALMAATMAMSLAACGGGDAPAGGSDNASNEPYKIRMTLKTNAAEFWNIIQAGAEAYEKEHPEEVKLSIYGLRERPTTRSSSTPSRPTSLPTMTAT